MGLTMVVMAISSFAKVMLFPKHLESMLRSPDTPSDQINANFVKFA